MLLQIGNVIINTAQLIYAELKEEGSSVELYVRLGGGGTNNISYTSRTFEGDTARAVWNVIRSNATEIDPKETDGLKKTEFHFG